jgi:hypothetical protein
VTKSNLRYRLLDTALRRGSVPDAVLRAGSLYGAWARERRESRGGVVGEQDRLRALVERMSRGPIAEVPGEGQRTALRVAGRLPGAHSWGRG